VQIASAVVASSAVPGVLRPMYLREKMADGSIKILPEEYWDDSIEQVCPNCFLASSKLWPGISGFARKLISTCCPPLTNLTRTFHWQA